MFLCTPTITLCFDKVIKYFRAITIISCCAVVIVICCTIVIVSCCAVVIVFCSIVPVAKPVKSIPYWLFCLSLFTLLLLMGGMIMQICSCVPDAQRILQAYPSGNAFYRTGVPFTFLLVKIHQHICHFFFGFTLKAGPIILSSGKGSMT
jgi:hypothetical protein